ncbi:FAD-binding oxidoreductase [Frankia sp. R82]|uniref:FAD-binding oxidoreductase n=1 Tax=Frankia sp. R82 TaxID=2950553 RepID=UPI002043684E|nr:FAD-binding protein [Frankia sp. R82]MCM3882365.1 FAD-binding protein [Frankia sp. R82]
MRNLSRRGLVGGAAATLGGGLLATPAVAADAPAATSSASATYAGTAAGPASTIGRADARYDDLIRGNNYRFAGSPDYVRLITSVDQVQAAVGDAVRENRQIAVRSGGHCLEGFVTDPAVKVVLDISQMSNVYYDATRHAFAVEAGASLGKVYETLFKQWGVTVPGGVCPQVGAGGHICGGGYGALSRLYGLVVDYLDAVEVVVVNSAGKPQTVVATSASSDPNRDLWWAHTGGGGGNFGVVTRYWLRDPRATGTDPAKLLPRPPGSLLLTQLSWPWAKLDQTSYTWIVANFTRWHEANSAPGSPASSLFATLWLNSIHTGDLRMIAQLDGTLPNATAMLDAFVSAVREGTTVQPVGGTHRTLPWWDAFRYSSFADFGASIGQRTKDKSSYLRKSYTEAQLAAIYRHLTQADYTGTSATILLASYGGQINSVAPDARAIPQRDSIIKAQYSVSWIDPAEDDVHLSWVRDLYRDIFTDTGGAPVPNANCDGAYINYPDVDLADPAWNTSSTPWSSLYYKGNYARLQQVKKHWDPQNRFRHALSVEPAR